LARIAILDDYQNLATTLADWSAIRATHDVTVFDSHIPEADALVAALEPYDAVCLMRERTSFGADVINRLPSLKFIVTAGMRNAAIDMDAARARGIDISGTPVSSHATAELTLGLMLSLARHIAVEAANMKNGGWQSTLGMELSGKTLGLLGLGFLGGKVAGITPHANKCGRCARFARRTAAPLRSASAAHAGRCRAKRSLARLAGCKSRSSKV